MPISKVFKSFASKITIKRGIIAIAITSLPVWGPWLKEALTWHGRLQEERSQILGDYYREMAKLLIDPKRKTFDEAEQNEMNYVARSLTLNALRGLDGVLTLSLRPLARLHPQLRPLLPDSLSYAEDTRSKESILKFLYESKLIGYCPTKVKGKIVLDPGQITRVSSEVDLQGASLQGVNLGAISSNLCGIDLAGTHLDRATARDVNLTYANLSRSDLRKIDLSGSTLTNADFSGGDLQGLVVDGRTTADGAIFKGASLCYSNLFDLYRGLPYSASMSKAVSKQLQESKLDRTTELPAMMSQSDKEYLYTSKSKSWKQSKQLILRNGGRPPSHPCFSFSQGE